MKDDDFRRHEGDDLPTEWGTPKVKEVGRVEEILRIVALLAFLFLILLSTRSEACENGTMEQATEFNLIEGVPYGIQLIHEYEGVQANVLANVIAVANNAELMYEIDHITVFSWDVEPHTYLVNLGFGGCYLGWIAVDADLINGFNARMLQL